MGAQSCQVAGPRCWPLPAFRDALTIRRKPAIKTATGRAYLAAEYAGPSCVPVGRPRHPQRGQAHRERGRNAYCAAVSAQVTSACRLKMSPDLRRLLKWANGCSQKDQGARLTVIALWSPAIFSGRPIRRSGRGHVASYLHPGGWSRRVKIRAVRVAAGRGRCRVTAGVCAARACGVGWLVRAARDAGCSWDAIPLASLVLGS